MKIDITRIKEYLPLSAILLLSLVLNIYAAAYRGDLLWDELFSMHFSQQPWADSWYYWLLETNPPAHMILLKFWFYIFPATALWARMFSVISATATVALFYLFCNQFTQKKTTLLATFFLAISVSQISSASFARGYSLLTFLSLLSGYLFIKIFVDQKNQIKNIAGFVVTNFFLLFTHLTAPFVFLAQLATLIIQNRAQSKKIIKYWLAPLVVWAVWTASSLILKSDVPVMGAAWFFNIAVAPIDYFVNIGSLMVGGIEDYRSAIIGIFVVVSIIWTIYGIPKKIISDKFIYLVLIALIPLLTAAAIGTWHIKFYWLSFPTLILIFSNFLNRISPKKWITYLIIALLCSNGVNNLYATLPSNDWQNLKNQIIEYRSNSKKQLLLSNLFVDQLNFQYFFYDFPIQQLHYSSNPLAPTNATELILNNYLFYAHTLEEINNWWKLTHPEQYDQIFLLEEKKAGVNLKPLFAKHGWKILYEKSLKHLPVERVIYLYENPKSNPAK